MLWFLLSCSRGKPNNESLIDIRLASRLEGLTEHGTPFATPIHSGLIEQKLSPVKEVGADGREQDEG